MSEETKKQILDYVKNRGWFLQNILKARGGFRITLFEDVSTKSILHVRVDKNQIFIKGIEREELPEPDRYFVDHVYESLKTVCQKHGGTPFYISPREHIEPKMKLTDLDECLKILEAEGRVRYTSSLHSPYYVELLQC